jgi:trehalose transport system permease protein
MNKIVYVVLAVFIVFLVYPIYVLFLVSFVPPLYTVDRLYPYQYPVSLTLDNLEQALSNTQLVHAVYKSLETATLVGGIAVVLGIPTAYGLSKLPEKIAYGITTLLFTVNMMPSIVVAIPIASDFIKLGLFDTALGLALAQELIALPLTSFILLGTFQSIPSELEFQARIDGASLFRSLIEVVLPLAREGIIASFLLSWMLSWDEFTFAVLISPIKPTLPVLIYLYTTRGNILEAAAFSLFLTLPVIILTILLQKYLRGEYLGGGLKG